MKSIYAKFSLFVLLASTVLAVFGRPNSLRRAGMRDEKEFRSLVEKAAPMDMEAFKRFIDSANLSETELLVLRTRLLTAPITKVGPAWRDEGAKMLFLAEKTSPQKRREGGLGPELVWAYKNNDRAMIKKLRALGGNISKVLEDAISSHPDTIPTLLRDGARPDVTVMQNAFLVSEFVSEPIDPELTADEREKARKVRKFLPRLLKAMKNIKQHSFYLLSSVHDPELVAMLLKVGVDINAQAEKADDDIRYAGMEGDTALIHAVKRLSLLQQAEKEDDLQQAEYERKESGEYLLPPDLSFITKARITRLKKMIPYLIQHDADPMIKNKKGESAFSLAKKAGLSGLVVGGSKKSRKRRSR